tara:strand:- start:85 stop:831 length:747 start_codon:yes stop_codon:yes gene_type:complete
MYRKGLSSRANKISSLVASSDNSGSGSIQQASVPNSGVYGIRKNVFRMLPSIPPKKSVTHNNSPEPQPVVEQGFPQTLEFNKTGAALLQPVSNNHVIFDSSTYVYQIIQQNGAKTPFIEGTEIGIPIPLDNTLSYTNVDINVNWEEIKVLSTYTENQGKGSKIRIYLVFDDNTIIADPGQHKTFFSYGNHYPNYNSNPINLTDKSFQKLSLLFWDEQFRSLDNQSNWNNQPLQISIKNLIVTISKPNN